MSEDSPIKDALYSKISAIGEESIHNLLLEKKYSELFEIMYENVLESIKEKFDENEIAGTLMESLIHYIFTEMLIPSQRKITYENIEFDIVIPNLMELKKQAPGFDIPAYEENTKLGYKVDYLKGNFT